MAFGAGEKVSGMQKIQLSLFGRSYEAEVHGLRGQRRYKVFGTISNTEAVVLGLSRITAWRSRRDGYFWLNYHEKEDNSSARGLSSEEVNELVRCARIGVRLALRSYGVIRLTELRPFELEDLVQEACEGLLRNSGRLEFQDEGWRIVTAKHAAMMFLRSSSFRGRSAGDPEVVFAECVTTDDLDTVEHRSLVAQIRAHVVLHHGFEAWDRMWSWACTTEEQLPSEVAALIREVIFDECS